MSIPSVALGMMAWRLAFRRVWGNEGHPYGPERRSWINGSATTEYYQIIDRIARGEKP